MCFARVKKIQRPPKYKTRLHPFIFRKTQTFFYNSRVKSSMRSRTIYVYNKSTGHKFFFFELEILHVFDHNYKRTFLDLPLSPSFEIRLRSRKCVPITVSPTVSLSLNWILIRWHNGGNISVKTICSFHTGLYEFFFIEVFPCLSKED